MNARWIAAAVFAALSLGVVVIDTGSDKPASGAERASALEPSKLSILPDGGRGYSIKVRVADGGSELRTTVADCARRPVSNKTCLRVDGGDPGELNRYPASELTGACQLVACSVWQGEDANAEEGDK